MLRKASRAYFDSLIKESTDDSQEYWNISNTIVGRKKIKPKLPHSFVVGENILTDKAEIANAFSDYFVNIGRDLERNDRMTTAKVITDYLGNASEISVIFRSIRSRNPYCCG